MNWQDKLRKIILSYSRNGGDYLPDYHYSFVIRDFEPIISELLKEQREICAEIYLKWEASHRASEMGKKKKELDNLLKQHGWKPVKTDYDFYKLQSNQIAVCIGRDKILNAPEPKGEIK